MAKSPSRTEKSAATQREKLTPSMTHFAQLVARGYSYSAAYREAYNVRPGTTKGTIWREGYKIAHTPKIRDYIAKLVAEAADRAVVTRESMLVEMAQNRDMALDAGEIGAAVTSSRDRARVAGLLKDKVELTGKDGAAIQVEEQVTLEDRSVTEIARRIAFALQKGKRAKQAAASS